MSNYQSHFLVDINLEVLSGCKWKCTGCNVNKNENNGFVGNDFNRLMNLFEDLQANNHVLINLAIGATDFMTARNSDDILNSELVPMLDMFKSIVLNTTFLSEKDVVEDWAYKLKPLLSGRRVKFTIPLEPRHIGNEKYFAGIKEKIRIFESIANETEYGGVYNIVNLYEYKKHVDPLSEFHEFSTKFDHVWHEGHLDLVISEGRLPLTDPENKQKVLKMVNYLNGLYEKAVIKDKSTLVNFNYGKRYEGYDKDYVYKNGNLYSTVFLGEPLIVYEEDSSLGKDSEWNYKTIVEFENQLMLNSLKYMEKTKDCLNCEFAPHCAGRGLLYLMEKLEAVDCLAPRDGFKTVNDNFYKYGNFDY